MAALTESEVQAQLRAAVDVFETLRNLVDGTLFPQDGKVDVLQQAARGTYLPSMIDRMVLEYRQACSGMLAPSVAQTICNAVLFEYGPLLAGTGTETEGRGAAYREPRDLMRALYEYLHDTSATVKSRAITYDTSAAVENATNGAIIGNGGASNAAAGLGRLTVDEYGYNLEACTVERKQFVCRSDRNTSARENAEVFEVFGGPGAPDNVLRAEFGSGDQNRTVIVSKHGGQGAGGSVLQNSSFDSYNSTDNVFAGWTNTNGTGGTHILQNTAQTYREAPGSSSNGSLQLDSAGGQVTVTQPQTAWRDKRLDATRPYFFRVMVNKDVGSASGGDLVVSLGDTSVTTALSAIGAGWQEITIPFDQNAWPRQFNPSSDLEFSIDWQTSGSSGYLLVDDVIVAPWDLIDGTYWCLRGNAASPTPWALDDVLAVTDTGGAPATGKIQWLFYTAGLGYLPSSGTPTIVDP